MPAMFENRKVSLVPQFYKIFRHLIFLDFDLRLLFTYQLYAFYFYIFV